MMCFIESLVKEDGATEIMLLTNKENNAGQSLYRKCEYTEQQDLVFQKQLD